MEERGAASGGRRFFYIHVAYEGPDSLVVCRCPCYIHADAGWLLHRENDFVMSRFGMDWSKLDDPEETARLARDIVEDILLIC